MTSPFRMESVDVAERLAAPRAGPSIIVLSAPLKVDLAVYKGDSGQFRITVTEPDGTPIDLTGAAWDGDIRVKANDTTVVTNFDIVPVAGDPSSIDVFLPADNSELLTNPLVYDIEMRQGTLVTTLVYGSINVTQDVSRP
jgi:hypothetical protein